MIEQDHQIASQITTKAGYTPHNSSQKALFYFLTEQWDKYESLDFEHTLLQTTYQMGDEQLRQRIAQKVRQAGYGEWLHIITGGGQKQQLGNITDAEWETILVILTQEQQWEEMYRIAQLAPPIWSVRLLQQLKDSGWIPKADVAELVKMGHKCVADVPDTLNAILCNATLQEHNSEVNCLAISPDNKLLASGSNDKTISLWNLPDGKLLQTLTGHRFWVSCLAISSNSRILASGSMDTTINLWNLPDGKLLQTLTGHSSWVNCLAIRSDGKLLASGSNDKTINLWNLPDGRLLQTLTGHTSVVNCLAISSDGKLLASGSNDKTINLWNLPDGRLLQTLTGHTDNVMCLAISLDSKQLVTGSADSTVKLWSLPDGNSLLSLIGHSNTIKCLAISRDSRLLVTGSGDKTVKLWIRSLLYLSRLPLERLSAEDMQWLQEILQNKTIFEAERNWLEFIQALVRWRRRFDVEVEETPQDINPRKFDIEIEG